MATDTLKVQGGGKLKQSGEDGQAAPEIDKEQFSPPPAPVGQATNTSTDESSDDTPKTTSSGRSRLIIQPK